MASKLSRRKFGKVAIGGAAAFAGITILGRSETRVHPGKRMSPEEFHKFSGDMSRVYGGYPTTYIPPNLRAPNTDGSCVHLATANIFLSMGLNRHAAEWTNSYRGGEYSSRHIRRMTAEGFYFAVETDGDPEFIDYFAGNTGEAAQRVCGCSYMARHVLNILDIDPANSYGPRAYLLNNQRRSGTWAWDSLVAAEVPRNSFLAEWNHRGGWAFTILGGKNAGVLPPNPPYPYIRNTHYTA